MILVLSGEKIGIEILLLLNPALNYSFPIWLDFEDYSESDLYEICIDTIKNKGFNLTDEANNYLKQVIYELYNDNNLSLKNGLMIKSYLVRLKRVQSVRVYKEKVSTKELNTKEKIDIEISKKQFIDKRRINLKTMF